MVPLSRSTQELVSSISSSVPAAGSTIETGTKLAAVVHGGEQTTRRESGRDLPRRLRRSLVDTFLPVVKRGDADTELPAQAR